MSFEAVGTIIGMIVAPAATAWVSAGRSARRHVKAELNGTAASVRRIEAIQSQLSRDHDGLQGIVEKLTGEISLVAAGLARVEGYMAGQAEQKPPDSRKRRR